MFGRFETLLRNLWRSVFSFTARTFFLSAFRIPKRFPYVRMRVFLFAPPFRFLMNIPTDSPLPTDTRQLKRKVPVIPSPSSHVYS